MFVTSKSRDLYFISEVQQKLNPKLAGIHYNLHSCI